jgi:hypothetical protein
MVDRVEGVKPILSYDYRNKPRISSTRIPCSQTEI